MDEVAALVGDVLMEFAVLLDSFLIIFGTGLHPAEPLLELRQLFLGGFQPVGRIGQFTAVRHIEVAHGIFQTNSGLRDRDNRLRLLHDVLIKDVGKIFARFGFLHCNPFQLPAVSRAARELGPDDPGLGHANAVPGIELADLFDTSVDVLLGYEVKDNKRATAVARLKDLAYRRDERGLAEADKLLIRYPNCFEAVYQSADLYGLFGFMRQDRKLLLRSIELMERARLLLGQNTDPEIGELSINRSIARSYFSMNEAEKAVEIFRSSNPQGIYNDFIGCTLGADLHHPDEAIPYLSRALIRCVASLLRIVIGYVNAYFDQGRFLDAIDILQLSLSFCSGLRKPGQNSFLDKISTEFYVYLSEAQAGLGLTDEAQKSLRTARALAEQFDRAPDYSVDSIRFVANDRPGAAFDDMGATAMEIGRAHV